MIRITVIGERKWHSVSCDLLFRFKTFITRYRKWTFAKKFQKFLLLLENVSHHCTLQWSNLVGWLDCEKVRKLFFSNCCTGEWASHTDSSSLKVLRTEGESKVKLGRWREAASSSPQVGTGKVKLHLSRLLSLRKKLVCVGWGRRQKLTSAQPPELWVRQLQPIPWSRRQAVKCHAVTFFAASLHAAWASGLLSCSAASYSHLISPSLLRQCPQCVELPGDWHGESCLLLGSLLRG